MRAAAPIGPVNARGIAAEAAHMIREAIMDGSFRPGEELREGSLAESLTVSRGSVREGLSILEREGIIRTGWHRPATVIPVSRDHARNLYRLRAGLDRIAAQGAAHHTRADGFSPALESLRSAVTDGAARSEVVRADLEFHDAVYEVADNAPLTSAWQAIRSQIRLYQLVRSAEPESGYDSSLVAEHSRYAEILTSGDVETAGRYAEQHVESALEGLLGRLGD
ncbi:GntR family transcriptional regulator [Streptomyces oceani]|uniref:GntR family transcriptional regulator n=1 Tax=Streptomyces oceani TaxID=1075402 RepID=A0A1E7JVW7_9ACTN|nr:GntR family transcriptional regulator [Streptomyces oceani]OEU94828.1 GntR family transcriptional regulator [Streptomyces oceani]